MRELRQTKQYAKYMSLIGWEIDMVEGVYCYTKKIPILGSVIKIQRFDSKVKIGKIKELAKEKRAFTIYLEPISEELSGYYLANGFKMSRSSSLPSKTIRIDLNKPEKKLLSEMHYKTRYNTKVAVKRGVVIEKSNNIKQFAEFWQKCAKERGMFLPLKNEIFSIYKAFGKSATILFAYKDEELLASILLVSTKDISYYMYAAATGKGKKLFAPTLVAWEAIRLAKHKGYKLFDFEGIYDIRSPIKTWGGFTRFKKSFGGEEIDFPLMLRKYYLPF